MKRWLDRLRGIGRASGPHRAQPIRWVVLDVETSGLDPAHDRLVSIGAVAVHDRRIVLADSFEVTLRQRRASARENILVHGIGEDSQRDGVEPVRALEQFVDYIGTSPLLAFHAAFDRGFILRAASAWLEMTPGNPWIDIAGLAGSLYPDVNAHALDDWLEHFGIDCEQRHNACADALVTAMLFLRVIDAVPANEREPRNLQRIAVNGRWLGR